MPQTNELAVFQGKQIRRVWHNNQWHFVILDIIRVLTDSPNPSDYLKKIRKREKRNQLTRVNIAAISPAQMIPRQGKADFRLGGTVKVSPAASPLIK